MHNFIDLLSRKSHYLLLLAVLSCFIFTRFFQIQTSLLYFNDMGRDSWVLSNWAESGKPPLLGPQTSALPFNQSAVYFYMLYPIFYLMHQSAFSSLVTCAVFYAAVFFFSLWIARKSPGKGLSKAVLITFWIMTIQPESFLQTRFIWNPSFVGPLVLLVCVTILSLQNKWQTWKATLLAVSLGLAVSLNYSALPFLLAVLCVIFWQFRKRFLFVLAAVTLSVFLLNLPTLLFEVRHNFLLTQMMLHRQPLNQPGAIFQQKTSDLLGHTLAFPHLGLETAFVCMLLVIVGISCYFFYRKNSNLVISNNIMTAACLWLLTLSITLLMPVSIHAHYIFPVLVSGVFFFAMLPWRLLFLPLCVVTFFWTQPFLFGSYYNRVQRTVSELEQCYQIICQKEHEPLFVSTEANFHVFHNGPEHRFLLKKSGCKVKEIETEPTAAQLMAVVEDGGKYEHGLTKYNELTLFGPSQQVRKYTCQPNLSVVILAR